MKRGQEVFGVGVIDVDNRDCMTLSAIQTPDTKSLEEMDYNLVDWYCQNLIILKEKLQKILRLIVADAFFSRETFVNPLLKEGFHVDKQAPKRCRIVLSHTPEAYREKRSSEVVRWQG